jgi:hypothetical protein
MNKVRTFLYSDSNEAFEIVHASTDTLVKYAKTLSLLKIHSKELNRNNESYLNFCSKYIKLRKRPSKKLREREDFK